MFSRCFFKTPMRNKCPGSGQRAVPSRYYPNGEACPVCGMSCIPYPYARTVRQHSRLEPSVAERLRELADRPSITESATVAVERSLLREAADLLTQTLSERP